MSENLSQKELEQTVKGYQIQPLVSELKSVNKKVDTILGLTSGLVTQAQLENSEARNKAYTDDEIEKVHLEYGPMKRNIDWMTKALVVEGIAIVGQVIIGYLLLKG